MKRTGVENTGMSEGGEILPTCSFEQFKCKN